MKFVFWIIAFLMLLGVTFFAEYNSLIKIAAEIPYLNITFEVNFLVMSFLLLIYGMLMATLVMLANLIGEKNKNKSLQNRLNKGNIFVENSDSKIQVLENKIKTLEIALKKALEEK